MNDTLRMVLLGKAGNGKSSLANTIFGETVFNINHFNDLNANVSQGKTGCVHGRSLTLIDTPGFFDLTTSEEDVNPEILRCIIESSPGPHAFLIVLKVEKFTEHEQAVITKICQYFSEDALKHAVVVFTQGDQLPEGMEIEEYVSQNEGLRDLVGKCGGRCHVFDNKYWKTEQQDEYRSNQFQLTKLLNTIDKMLAENMGSFYINPQLQEVEREIQKEAERLRKSSKNMSDEEVIKQAKMNIFKKQVEGTKQSWNKSLLGSAAGVLAGVLATLHSYRVVDVIQEVRLPEPNLMEALSGEGIEPSPMTEAEEIWGTLLEMSPTVSDTEHEAEEAIDRSPPVTEHVDEEAIDMSPPLTEHEAEEAIDMSPPVTEHVDEGAIDMSPPVTEHEAEEAIDMSPPVTEHVDEGAIDMSPPVTEYVDEGAKDMSPPVTEHVDEGAIDMSPPVTEHVDEGAKDMSPPVTEHVDEGAIDMSPPVTEHEAEGAIDMSPPVTEHVDEEAIDMSPPVTEHVDEGAIDMSPPVTEHVDEGAIDMSPPVTEHVHEEEVEETQNTLEKVFAQCRVLCENTYDPYSPFE